MNSQDEVPFHIVSPLKESPALSRKAGTQVLIKLENIQPVGSFKIRGIGHFCQKAPDFLPKVVRAAKSLLDHFYNRQDNPLDNRWHLEPIQRWRWLVTEMGKGKIASTQLCGLGGLHYWFQPHLAKEGCKKFVCSSGGNAGLAAAYACNKLGLPATIVVPEQTLNHVIQRLKDLGAEVVVTGKVWDDADAHAHRLAEAPGSVYISPFNHPLLWEGHSSLVLELKAALGNQKPGALVVSVGGGGLLSGTIEGLSRVGWSDVPIIAMETLGAHCLNAALEAGKSVTLPDITSIAKCLGAKTVCDRALECARKYKVISVVVDDREAVQAIEMFLDDELMLVEAACGAALSAVYSGHIQRLQQEGKLQQLQGPLIMIVCGGSAISLSELQNFKSQLGMV